MARLTGNPLTSPAALSRFVLVMSGGLGLDLWTKARAAADLSPDPSNYETFAPTKVHDFIHGWVQFEYILNPGAVFGIAPNHRAIFLLVSVLAIAFLTYLFSTSRGRPFNQIILGMLLAGVLGNMYDRVVIGKVRDMIHILPDWKWPQGVHNTLHFLPAEVFPYIFNVADSLLCTGVALMLVYSFFSGPVATDSQPALAAPRTHGSPT